MLPSKLGALPSVPAKGASCHHRHHQVPPKTGASVPEVPVNSCLHEPRTKPRSTRSHRTVALESSSLGLRGNPKPQCPGHPWPLFWRYRGVFFRANLYQQPWQGTCPAARGMAMCSVTNLSSPSSCCTTLAQQPSAQTLLPT